MGDGRWGVSMRRYTLAGFATLGTRQSRAVEVAGERATVDATRSFVAASRHAEVEAPGSGAVDASAYRAADPSYLIPGMRRFGLSRYGMPGTLQSCGVAVECAGGSLDATRLFAAAPRTVAVEAPLEVLLDAQAYLAAAPSYLVPGMRRFGLSRFSCPGTQVRQVSVGIAEATVDATRSFAAADRIAEVEVLGGALDAQAYLAAAPSYLVPGARRFGLSRFSAPGSLQSRPVSVEGAAATLAATRDPLVAADRLAAIAAAGGYLAGRSYAVPDVTGGVSVMFEGVPGMTADIQFKRGSTLPVYPITLYRPDVPSEPLPLAGAAVRLVAKSRFTGATVIDEALEILDATAGLCQFSREVGDYLQGDRCKAEIIVTFGNGAVLILPTTGYYSLTIEDSLA